jgi:hypothetical protein
MPKAAPPITSFNGGEWSPLMEGRVDLDRYGAACRTLENFIPMVQGGAQKRPGFRFVAPADTGRLIPFSFNSTDSYILVFQASAIRFIRDNAPLFDSVKNITAATAASPVVITSNAHGFVNGDIVYIQGVVGMVDLNNRQFVVAGATANTFQLSGVNGTGYLAYTSGGTASRFYSIATPYNTPAQIAALQWAGQNDVMYIASPDFPPYKLSRFGDTDWTFEEVDFDYVPFAPENTDDDAYMVATAATGSISLTSTSGVFEAGHVGSYVKLREVIESNNAKWERNTNFNDEYVPWSTAAAMAVGEHCYHEDKVYELEHKHGGTLTGAQPPVWDEGIGFDGRWEWEFYNYGFGYARIDSVTSAYRAAATVIVPLPPSTVSADRTISSANTANPIVVTTTANHLFETGDKVFIRNAPAAPAGFNNVVLEVTRISGTTFSVPVNGAGSLVTSGTVVRVASGVQAVNTLVRPVSGLRWSLGAWSDVQGYPRAVTFFEDRLIWAGTRANPTTFWASVTGDYEDHRTFDADDSALVGTLSSSDPIQWMIDANALVIGTTAEEYATNRNAAEPLSPGTVTTIRARSRYGSRSQSIPVAVENVILMTQRAGRKVRELVWDDTQDSFTAPDLTRLAEHISRGLFLSGAFQSEPYRLLWMPGEDGSLAAFTYERDEQVFCWHRHPIGGTAAKVLSVAVIPHPDGDADQLWALTERTVGATTVRAVEYLDRVWDETRAIEDAYFVDGGFTYDGAPTATVSGLWMYAGESLSVLADGIDVGPLTVDSHGRITLPTAASVVQVGYGYGAVLVTLRIEAGAADGTSQGKIQRVHRAVIRLHQMGGDLEYGPDASNFRQKHRAAAGTLYDGDTPLLAWPAGHERGARMALRHMSPLPCAVLALFPNLTTTD